jgi:hypothetical protein
MNKPFIEIDAENFTLSAFETKPIEGYEVPTNKETGEQFPNCCSFHKSVFEGAEIWFSKFPNCCEPHKEFTGKWWFKKENYNGIAEKIVKQLSYTEHHISERIKKTDWYKDITDYIEYNISSFGHPAVGLHLYLGNVKHYIQNTKSELNKEQRQRLIEFIEGYYKPSETEKTDLNILYSTYQKWLKEFPFELNSYFGNLKQHFEKQLPILNGKPEVNIYSGIAKAKMHTKSSLIEALINLTNSLLTQINGVTLYEMGLITDANKIKLELVINSRKLKLKQGYKNSSPNEEQQYRKILKEWFKDEKNFIDEITPLLKALPPQQTETKTEQETPKTFEELFYNPEHAEPCLKILSELQPPVIDAINNYIGKAKGVFPLWVKVLKNHKPEPLIKHFKDAVYKDLLNQKVKGLNLSKDASEFRKLYKRVENDKIELDIKTILSQYSQSGKLGK